MVELSDHGVAGVPGLKAKIWGSRKFTRILKNPHPGLKVRGFHLLKTLIPLGTSGLLQALEQGSAECSVLAEWPGIKSC